MRKKRSETNTQEISPAILPETIAPVMQESAVTEEYIQSRMLNLKMAERLGLNTTDNFDLVQFMNAMRYAEIKMSNPKMTDEEISKIMNIDRNTIQVWKRKEFISIASQVILALYLSDQSRDDIRQKMFASLTQYLPEAVENIAKMAAGMPGTNGKYPPANAQVDAYTAIATTPLGQAFVHNLFLGDPGVADEKSHLQLRDGLSAQISIDLDSVIDADHRTVSKDS